MQCACSGYSFKNVNRAMGIRVRKIIKLGKRGFPPLVYGNKATIKESIKPPDAKW